MFQELLPDPEGEVGQPCETCTLGFPICHGFCTIQPVPKALATAGGEIRVVVFDPCSTLSLFTMSNVVLAGLI